MLISVFNASAETLAVQGPVLEINVTPETVPTPSAEVKIQYYLPYPGILPDHPLYTFKMIRDRIWLALTTDSLKKAEVTLLFADKRLGAAKALIEGNKFNLGLTTLQKAEKYLEQAAGQLEEAGKKGKEIEPLAEKLATASLKHEEVIGEMAAGFEGEARSKIEELLPYPRQVWERVEKLMGPN